MSRVGNPGPLEGVRVLDLARYHAGPYCGLMLSRLGADVIKVEPPEGEDSRHIGPFVRGQSAYWVQYNAGKRSLALDLYSEKGKEILRRLVAVSDIFLQNYRPGTIEEMGFDYETLKSLNPKIVMVNVSAYGQYGPYWERPGDDRVASALGGFMMGSGPKGAPPVIVGETVVDHMTAMSATVGALAAWWEAQQSGEGQSLDVALADSAYSTMAIPISYCKAMGDEPPVREGTASGFTKSYNCKDGVAYLQCTQAHFQAILCEMMGHAEWIEEGGIALRDDPEAVAELEKGLAGWFGQRTVQEAVGIIRDMGAPIAPVNTVVQAAEDPHPWARDVLVEVPDPVAGKLHVIGDVMHYSRSGYHIGPGPTPGQHTHEILTELLGMTEAAIRQLKRDKVV
ncbi:MAG: CoA transferase [Dehalococcoidia bacterium]|nr:CoA transferase [Dehalococcoidia bacterium]